MDYGQQPWKRTAVGGEIPIISSSSGVAVDPVERERERAAAAAAAARISARALSPQAQGLAHSQQQLPPALPAAPTFSAPATAAVLAPPTVTSTEAVPYDRKPRGLHMELGGREAVARRKRIDRIVFGIACFFAALIVVHVVGKLANGGGAAPSSSSDSAIAGGVPSAQQQRTAFAAASASSSSSSAGGGEARLAGVAVPAGNGGATMDPVAVAALLVVEDTPKATTSSALSPSSAASSPLSKAAQSAKTFRSQTPTKIGRAADGGAFKGQGDEAPVASHAAAAASAAEKARQEARDEKEANRIIAADLSHIVGHAAAAAKGGDAKKTSTSPNAAAVTVVVSDAAFEAALNLPQMLRLRYDAVAPLLGSHRRPRRLVLFATLKPCYDTNIRFAQLDAVQSWASLPLATRTAAPFLRSDGDGNASSSSSSVGPLPPPPVSVYLLVGGADNVEREQLESYVEAQTAQRSSAEAKERRRREKAAAENNGYAPDEKKKRKDLAKQKKAAQKALYNSFYPFGPTPEAMTEGQCSQWIADVVNAGAGEGTIPPSHMHLAPSSPSSLLGGDEGAEAPPQPLSHRNRSEKNIGNYHSAPMRRGPVRVIPRAETPRGPSGTVLLGASIYTVVDRAVTEEIGVIAAEAEAMLLREVGGLYERWVKQQQKTAGGGSEKEATSSTHEGAPRYDYSPSLRSAIARAARHFAAKSLSFDEIADRIAFGFINGDILLDPLAAVALQRAQDAFSAGIVDASNSNHHGGDDGRKRKSAGGGGGGVFIIGKRRSVKIKLKHRQSAIAAGVVAPSSDDDGDEEAKDAARYPFGRPNADATEVLTKDSTFDVSTAGWEAHPIFRASAGDRNDAEDFFIWSGAFWSRNVNNGNNGGGGGAAEIAPPPIARSSSGSGGSQRLSARHNMKHIPNFHIGRPVFDNWFVNKAVQTWQPVVDASALLPAYHQIHNYAHLKSSNKEGGGEGGSADGSYWGRAESEENNALALANGGWRYGTMDFAPIAFEPEEEGGGREGGGRADSQQQPPCVAAAHAYVSSLASTAVGSAASHLSVRSASGEEKAPADGSESGSRRRARSLIYRHIAEGSAVSRVAGKAKESEDVAPSGLPPSHDLVFALDLAAMGVVPYSKAIGEAVIRDGAAVALAKARRQDEAAMRFSGGWPDAEASDRRSAASQLSASSSASSFPRCPLRLKSGWVPFEDNPAAFGNQERPKAWEHYYGFSSAERRNAIRELAEAVLGGGDRSAGQRLPAGALLALLGE